MKIRDEILIEMSYVQRSKYRTKVMKSIGGDVKIPSAISKDLRIKTSHISKVLNELKKHELVECITPEVKKGRLYRLTDKGNEVVKNLNGYEEAPPASNVERSADKKRKKFEQLLERISDLNNQEKYKEANKCLNKALKFKQKLYYIFYLKGETFINLNNYKKAINCFNKSLELDSMYVPSLNAKGNALMHLNMFDDAIKCFDAVISLNPEDSNALNDSWVGKAECLIKLKNYKEANKCLNKALKFKQKLYYIFYLKGETFIYRNNYKEAINCFNKSLELDSMYVPSLNAKGNALMHLNMFDDAIKCFDAVISLNPEDSNALNDSWGGKAESLIRLENMKKHFPVVIK